MDWSFLGKHVLAEFEGIRATVLNDEPLLRETLLDALAESGSTVLDIMGKRFDPQGVTVLALLAESHASIHTYPEHGSMFVDVFTCGAHTMPGMAVERLAQILCPSRARTTSVTRGDDSLASVVTAFPRAVVADTAQGVAIPVVGGQTGRVPAA